MKHAFILTLGICTIGFSGAAYAQIGDYDTGRFSQSVEARVGLKIPFGGDYRKANAKPQLAFGLRSQGPRANSRGWALGALTSPNDTNEFKLALTLEPMPNFLLNDQILSLEENTAVYGEKLNALDTYDKTVLTVIGVSLAVIAGAIVITAE